jgi:hydroxymethylbilane synthase
VEGPLRIGTRGSALALWQANHIAALLGGEHEIVVITTAGDRGEGIGDKTRWTSALEQALLADRIDVAVHSAKDVPGELAEGTVIGAIPVRADASDAICGTSAIASLASGARVGTSSIRRIAQIRALRTDLEFVEVRGNVDTRLRKLADGEVDALVLAYAGLDRLGRAAEAGGLLPELTPAPGQGALLVQARGDDQPTLGALSPIRDELSERCVIAERAIASNLNASCNTPFGASAAPDSATDVQLRAWIGLPDGSHWIADEITGAASEVGTALAERMISVGARELLVAAEEMAA